jgi:hypothetical protein
MKKKIKKSKNKVIEIHIYVHQIATSNGCGGQTYTKLSQIGIPNNNNITLC